VRHGFILSGDEKNWEKLGSCENALKFRDMRIPKKPRSFLKEVLYIFLFVFILP
jgi:hypothetical protein